jgi:PH (Pleckstrin Homology) domain-containing protein
VNATDPSNSLLLIFPSKVDRWILGLMAVPLGLSVVAVTSALLAHPPLPAALLIVSVEVVILVFVPRLLKSTRYLVGDRELIVRSSLFRWRIPIDSIDSIRPSRSPASSPALSLDRLEITYEGGRKLLISPQDREGFLAAVVARSRHLHRAGEQVRRSH